MTTAQICALYRRSQPYTRWASRKRQSEAGTHKYSIESHQQQVLNQWWSLEGECILLERSCSSSSQTLATQLFISMSDIHLAHLACKTNTMRRKRKAVSNGSGSLDWLSFCYD